MSNSEIDKNKLVIRRATPADKEAVLRIRDHVYDGHDYLPAYYEHFMSSSPFTPIVMVYDEEIVGFEVIQVVDDGQTQIGRAGRVNRKYERQGLAKQAGVSMKAWRQKSNIKRIAFTAVDANPALSRPSFLKNNKLILTKRLPLYCVNIIKVHYQPEDITQATRLEVVSEQTLSHYFKSNEIKEYLSPQNYMVVDWVPLKMTDTNIPFMKEPEGYTSSFSDIRVDDGRCRGLLSFGTTIKIQNPPFKCNLDLFGTDTSSLKAHIVRHMMVMGSKVDGVVGVFVLVQEDFDM